MMTKADFITEIARVLETSRKEARALLEAMLDGMVHAIRRGERVEIRGFGTFSTRIRAPRRGRNPVSGTPMVVSEKRVAWFKPSRQIKESVNESAKSGKDR